MAKKNKSTALRKRPKWPKIINLPPSKNGETAKKKKKKRNLLPSECHQNGRKVEIYCPPETAKMAGNNKSFFFFRHW